LPLYDVKCESCGEVQEISKKMSEDHPPCQLCGGKLNTYFAPDSGIGVVYKGGGWAGKEIAGERSFNRDRK